MALSRRCARTCRCSMLVGDAQRSSPPSASPGRISAHGGAQAFGNLHQNRVAASMSQGVVDVPEWSMSRIIRPSGWICRHGGRPLWGTRALCIRSKERAPVVYGPTVSGSHGMEFRAVG